MTTRKKSASADLFANVATGVGVTRGTMSGSSGTGRERTLDSSIAPPSVFGKGGAADPAGQYWVELLNALGQRFGVGESELVDFLSGIGLPTGHDISDAQLTDLNKQFVDSLLSAASEQDARNYNQQMLADQRLYDNPQNQLARLMGAGISRDAAIQMLSGAGGGAGGVVTGQAASMSTGVSATQSDLNKIQGNTAIANTVFGGISAISGLVSLGFSVPQAIQQMRFMGNQINLSNRQMQAYDSASAAFTILNAAGSAADAFGSATSAAAAIKSLARDGNTDAQQFVASGGLDALVNNAPFSSPVLAKMYRDERSSNDYALRYSKENDLLDAESDLKKVDKDKCLAEIVNLGATFDQILAETDFINEQAALARWNQRLTKSEIKHTDASTAFIKEQTKGLQLENELTESVYNTNIGGMSGLEVLTARDANAAYVQMKSLIQQKDSALWEDEINYMASNYKMLTSFNALKHAFYKGGKEFQETNPEFFKMCCAFEECGGWSYIDRMIQINTTDMDFKLGPLRLHSKGPTKLGALQFYGHTKGGEYKMKFDNWIHPDNR